MKNISGIFKSKETRVNGIELLNVNEMQKIRGGAEPPRPTSRPREVYDNEEV